MSEIFPNAPLVELVAEVRWNVAEPEPGPLEEDLDSFSGSHIGPDEQFFRDFAANLAREGFTRSERIVPEGFEAPAPNAVYRFLSSGDEEGQVIYHVGRGVMSVNAIPPYKSWDVFRPAVERGLNVLFATLGDHKPESFERVILRYIDAFGDEFLEGGSRYDFLIKTLGFGFTFPPVIAGEISSDDPTIFFQMRTKTKSGFEIVIRTGEATVSNAKAVVLDMSVSMRTPTESQVAGVLSVLDSSHAIVNSTFVGMTKPVVHILRKEHE